MKTKFKFAFKKPLRHCLLVAIGLHFLLGMVPQVRAGSLWREAVTDEKGMFADRKARRVGDIVQVIVQENIVLSNGRLFNTEKTSGGTPGLAGQFVGSLINSVTGRQSAAAQTDPARKKFPQNLLPKSSTEDITKSKVIDPAYFSSDIDAKGSSNTTQRLTTRMSAQVIDVLPNGNLVIEGIRQVGMSKERVFLSLRGIIRPADILAGMRTATNVPPEIYSYMIADARIELVSEGMLSDANKKGWLQRLDDKITPY